MYIICESPLAASAGWVQRIHNCNSDRSEWNELQSFRNFIISDQYSVSDSGNIISFRNFIVSFRFGQWEDYFISEFHRFISKRELFLMQAFRNFTISFSFTFRNFEMNISFHHVRISFRLLIMKSSQRYFL